MAKHPVLSDPPTGYGAGCVAGKDLHHLVKYEPFNAVALCGVYLQYDQDSFHGTPRPVCRRCVKKYEEETGRKINDPEPERDADA